MRIVIASLLVGGALAAGACVQNPQPNGPPGAQQAQGSGSGSDMECHEETPTGSSISREVCRPKAVGQGRDEDEIMRGMQQPGPSSGPGSH
jgi:hypothetical protein|nr:hypothetical protein [Kofleriaceae bacterium]